MIISSIVSKKLERSKRFLGRSSFLETMEEIIMGVEVVLGAVILGAGAAALAYSAGKGSGKSSAPAGGAVPAVPNPADSLIKAQEAATAKRRVAMSTGGQTLGTGSAGGAILQQSQTYQKTLLGG
jgi:hypothetical protein